MTLRNSHHYIRKCLEDGAIHQLLTPADDPVRVSSSISEDARGDLTRLPRISSRLAADETHGGQPKS